MSLNKPLACGKLNNIYEMYKPFVPESRYPQSLLDAIQDGRVCYISDNGQVASSNTANGVDEESFRVG